MHARAQGELERATPPGRGPGPSCISHSFSSTGRLAPDVFKSALLQMEQAWPPESPLNKSSINCMIGLWQVDSMDSFSIKTTAFEQDGGDHWAEKRLFSCGDTLLYDFVYKTTRVCNESMCAIHAQIMHTEAVRVAQLRFCLEKLGVPCKSIVDVKTDSLVLCDLSRKVAHLLDAKITHISFQDLPSLKRKFEGCDQGQTQLDSLCDLKQVNEAELVFKTSKPGRLRLGDYKEPHREATSPAPRALWAQLSEEEAREHVIAGGSLLVEGWPGTGKTHSVREWVKALGKRVFVIAKTHQQCANWGPECITADHFTRKYVANGCCPCDLLVIEECSMINAYLWSAIVKCKMLGTAVICVGDFKQLEAVKDRWLGVEIAQGALEASDMLHNLCEGRRVRFVVNKRSDPPLFDFIVGMRERSLDGAIQWARDEFPLKKGLADWTLCLTHARRICVNNAHLGSEAHHGTKHALGDGPTCVSPGMRLVGYAPPFRKGQIYCLTGIEPLSVDSRPVANLEGLRLAFAITICSCQGMSLRGSVRILESDHPRFGMRHLYVAASRATSAQELQVA